MGSAGTARKREERRDNTRLNISGSTEGPEVEGDEFGPNHF